MKDSWGSFPSMNAPRIDADTAAVLRELGIETVGQLLPLPRAELALRFSDRLLLRLDQFTGAAPEVLVPHREPAALEVGCTFEHPTADRAISPHPRADPSHRRAGPAFGRARPGAILLVGSLRCADGQTVLLRIGLVEPTASARRLMELIDLHVETLALTDEVVHVELRAAVIGRLGERQGELFAQPWPTDPHQLALLMNRLSSRLGYEQVVRPELCEPVAGMRGAVCADDRNADWGLRMRIKTPNPQSEIRIPNYGPLLLYPEPRPVKVLVSRPTGRRNLCGWRFAESGSSRAGDRSGSKRYGGAGRRCAATTTASPPSRATSSGSSAAWPTASGSCMGV